MQIDRINCREVAGGINVRVKVQPRASRNMITGLVGDSLKLALTSPPVEGAANEACILFFAGLCGVAKSQVAIISGQKSREKVVRIAGVDMAHFVSALKSKVKID